MLFRSGAYTVFQVHDINPQFLYYYYLSLDNIKALKPLYTGLRKTIKIDTFLALKLPVPPPCRAGPDCALSGLEGLGD